MWIIFPDISAEVDPQQVDGIETPSVYYPSLYGAPDGIVAVARYGGKPYGFTTGSRVVSNVTTMAATSTEILLPDSITEFNETVISGYRCTAQKAPCLRVYAQER